jgi:phage baseplate assembly protein W
VTAPNGPHLAFPFRIARDGRAACVETLEQHVRDELIQLILTNLAERENLPEFGAGVRRLVFDGAGLTAAAMAKAMVSQALSRWLAQRITVEELDVIAVDERLEIDLTYRIPGQTDSRRVRFQRGGG